MSPNNDLGYAKACQLFDKTTSRIDQSLWSIQFELKGLSSSSIRKHELETFQHSVKSEIIGLEYKNQKEFFSLQTNIDFLKMILVFGFVINIFLIILLLKK
jgi:hypothetical protein